MKKEASNQEDQISSVMLNEFVGSIESERDQMFVNLNLRVTNLDAVRELKRYPEGPVRNDVARSALTIGLLSIRSASAQLDTEELRDAGDKLLHDLESKLNKHGEEVVSTVTVALSRYLDPDTGHFTQRVKSLVNPDGELNRLLLEHLDGDDSLLAKALANQIGENSPIFKMLSPDQTSGLQAQLTASIEKALAEQRSKIVSEFSLDREDSSLSRLNRELTARHGEITNGIRDKMEALSKEFSFDEPGSALSRLVESLNSSHRSIAAQFSADNQDSALNKITAKLDRANEQIANSLSLDNEHSAVCRLKKTLDDFVKSNQEFQSQVQETLAVLHARKQEAKLSPRHGIAFEEAFGELLQNEVGRVNDIFDRTGNSVGVTKNCKKGDFVTSLGAESRAPESRAPEARIVWEAKDDRSYTLKRALDELQESRKNRQAQIGVFVFSREAAPAGLEGFSRYGDNIVVVWDPEDGATDLFVHAALSVARALVVKEVEASADSQESLVQIELATRAVDKQLNHVAEIGKWAETAKNASDKISQRTERMHKDLSDAVQLLDLQINSLRRSA